MRMHLGWIVAGFIVGLAVVGCRPSVSESDLGTIVYEVPTVAGADAPFPFPKLPPPAPGSEADRRMKQSARRPPGIPPGMGPPGLPPAPPPAK
jgi:hypothetical protein